MPFLTVLLYTVRKGSEMVQAIYFTRVDRKPILRPIIAPDRAELVEAYALAHSRYLVDCASGRLDVSSDDNGAELVTVPSIPRGLCASAGKLVRQLVTCGYYAERSADWIARAAYFAQRGASAGLSVHLVQLCIETGRNACRGAVVPI